MRAADLLEKELRLLGVHQTRLHELVQHVRPVVEISEETATQVFEMTIGRNDVAGQQASLRERRNNLTERGNKNPSGLPLCISDLLADQPDIGPEVSRLVGRYLGSLASRASPNLGAAGFRRLERETSGRPVRAQEALGGAEGRRHPTQMVSSRRPEEVWNDSLLFGAGETKVFAP